MRVDVDLVAGPALNLERVQRPWLAAATGDPLDQVTAAFDLTATRSAYADAFAEYASSHGEAALYRASLLSQRFVKLGLGPEEIVALHREAVDQVCEGCSDRKKVRLSGDGLQFLLEVMIAYGVQHAAYSELRAHEAEQRTLEARKRADEAQQADQRKAELMALVAHELRTPITAALGQVQLALRALARGDADRVPRLLHATEETLRRLSRLTADLVEASRGETPVLDRVPQELVVHVRQACSWASTAAGDKGVDLDCDREEWDARVLGDADALLTIFGNLISNAIRYTPAGGSVVVRHGTVAGFAWVEVRDTGIGMSAEVQEHIFEQFFRGPEAHRIEQQGLGLGLFLVHRLVQAHGGMVRVTSAPRAGSTFTVRLPLLGQEGSIPPPEEIHDG